MYSGEPFEISLSSAILSKDNKNGNQFMSAETSTIMGLWESDGIFLLTSQNYVWTKYQLRIPIMPINSIDSECI